MSPEEFRVIEAMITERAREIARTELSRAFRRIADDLAMTYSGSREADDVISYLGGVFQSMADQT